MSELASIVGMKRDVMLRSLERLIRFRFAHVEPANTERLAIHTRIAIAAPTTSST
ncbi:MAG TPA: hypothetical protein VMD59_02720 [Acidimicrobiales bacterium]|nr:hypothetical protein [Acidimicrobiales bacterium]